MICYWRSIYAPENAQLALSGFPFAIKYNSPQGINFSDFMLALYGITKRKKVMHILCFRLSMLLHK
jgi:hypothetical protein